MRTAPKLRAAVTDAIEGPTTEGSQRALDEIRAGGGTLATVAELLKK
jgi:hypothetical protein